MTTVDTSVDHEQIVIHNVAFEPDSVVITFSLRQDVRVAGQQTVLVLGQQMTLTRTEDLLEGTEALESDVKELLLDALVLFGRSPNVADAEAAAADERDDDDDDERGMGE